MNESGPKRSLPLRDVKICDLMWVMAGPASTRILADYGARVVRVESPSRMDAARTVGPFHHNQIGPDSSALFGNNNAGKLDLALDLNQPQAREVVLDLVRWADVVTESFTPKAMRAWRLDYESLRQVKPDLIMLSSCLMGQSGPLAMYAGFGNLASAMAGFYNICGWPDRPPAGPFSAYSDYVAPRFTAVAILAALDHRRRTGEGQYIDQAQSESALHFLAPAILDHGVNGRVWDRCGNRDRDYAPHGVYPASGDDRWVAIVCRTDDEWRALCAVIEQPQLAGDERFGTPAARIRNAGALDELLARWTGGRDRYEIERDLQEVGIAAAVVQDSADCMNDPQLRHRGHLVELPHPSLGRTVVEGTRFKLSRTPAEITRAAPSLGQDNQYVLEEILGYSEERISALVQSGALG
ncbi:MAG: CaiB/BaiF CoA transferase family protein [Candidatus Binataceae bacterium]